MGFELLQLLVGEGHIDALLDLVSLYQLIAIDDRIVDRAIDFLLDAAFVLGVKEVEADRLGPGRGVQLYRDGHEAKGEMALPDNRWHTLD